MWSSASSVVIKSSRYHPEITAAAPHHFLFSPHPDEHYAVDVGPRPGTDGNGGVDEDDLVWFSSVRFAARLRFLVLALCSATIVSVASPASARSHHGARHHARSQHLHHYAERHRGYRHYGRHLARAARAYVGGGPTRAERFANAYDSIPPQNFNSAAAGSSSNIVAEARRYIGGNPTGRASLWCARFMNMVLQRSGHSGTGSDMARSFASYGQRISGPQVGAIAVMRRRGGGHVGIVSGIDANGNPILVSGNNGNRVREAAIPRGRIYTYVMPTS